MIIVFGAQCCWWDSIDKTSKFADGLPVCPHCKGVLYQCESEEKWMAAVDDQDNIDPGYKDMVLWMRGQCFKTIKQAREFYDLYRNNQ